MFSVDIVNLSKTNLKFFLVKIVPNGWHFSQYIRRTFNLLKDLEQFHKLHKKYILKVLRVIYP